MIKLFKVKPATKQSGTSGLTLSQFLLQQKPRGIAILPSPEIVSLSIVGQPSPHPTPPHPTTTLSGSLDSLLILKNTPGWRETE